MYELRADSAAEYLRAAGVIGERSSVRTSELGGGVSNRVLRVETDSDCVVLKQPFANLDVEQDWPADSNRVHNEAEAARTFRAVIDRLGLDPIEVPDVRYEDRENHVIAIECAPVKARTWKQALLAGRVDPDIARLTGRVTGAVHRVTESDSTVRARFPSKRPFDQLRLEPYHYATAEAHPDVADQIIEEAERVRSVEQALVHGDYSPKNVLLDPGPGPVRAWILDFEVAHWGDPAFDVAFMLNHLFIKSVYNHESGDEYVGAAESFYESYAAEVPWDLEREVASELAVLMLARIDGKSPVEYVTDPGVADAIRTIARRAIKAEVSGLAEFTGIVAEGRARL